MEKPAKGKKGMKLSALDRKILLAYSGMLHETAVKPTNENNIKKGIPKF